MIDRHNTRNPVEDIRTMGRLFPAADAAALADGETEAGAEYLVIAALDLPDGSARRAFERAGADPDAFSGAVRAQHGDALRSIGMQPLNDDVLDVQLPKQLTPAKWVKGAPSGHDLFPDGPRPRSPCPCSSSRSRHRQRCARLNSRAERRRGAQLDWSGLSAVTSRTRSISRPSPSRLSRLRMAELGPIRFVLSPIFGGYGRSGGVSVAALPQRLNLGYGFGEPLAIAWMQ